MPHYVIIADGPFLPDPLIKTAIINHVVIALDGAVNHLQALDIIPDVILGDFDSIDSESQIHWGIRKTFSQLKLEDESYIGEYGVRIVPRLDQNFTDLEKAIQYCDQHAAEQITLLCATGGREDLHEGMKIAIQNAYRYNRPILVHTNTQTLRYAQDESIQFHGQCGDYCGFIGLNSGRCSSEGLIYECESIAYSICNRMKFQTATIHVQGGAILIMPLQLARF